MSLRDKIEHAIQNQPCMVKDLKAKFGGDRAADRKVMEALDETTGTPLTALSPVRSRRVLTKRTAAALQALLAGVVAGGTGHEAALPGQTAAGKTGTAQTGQFSGGTELKNYWFAGFVQAAQPRYTIVVLQDTQAEPAFSSAAIFARVAAGLEILAP